MNLSVLKKKSTLVAIAIVVLIGGGIFLKSRANDGPFYETQAVERGLLKQTVDVTGEAKPQTRVDLSFKTGGKLENLLVTVGQTVKMGDVLATLDAQDANFALRRAAASLAQAQANLAARQAQDSPQAIQIAEAQRDQARASLEKAQTFEQPLEHRAPTIEPIDPTANNTKASSSSARLGNAFEPPIVHRKYFEQTLFRRSVVRPPRLGGSLVKHLPQFQPRSPFAR